MTIAPYLFFDGNCAEAFESYAEIFGGEIVAMMRFSDAPPGEDMPDVPGHLVMHATLMVGSDMLMGSDDIPGRYIQPAACHIYIDRPDFDSAKTAFERLADGGEVMMPFGKTFWSEGFGNLRDKWGVLWMVAVADPS